MLRAALSRREDYSGWGRWREENEVTGSKRGVELARLGALGGEASDNQDAEEKRVKRVAAGGVTRSTVYSMNSKVAWEWKRGRGRERGPLLCACSPGLGPRIWPSRF